MSSYYALRNTNIIFPKKFLLLFNVLAVQNLTPPKNLFNDTQFLYIVNITTKIPNFNTEYQAMSLQCRKSFEFENSKFSNCLLCAKKKHTATCLVCRVPSCSTRRSGLFVVCPMRHTAKLSDVNLRRPSAHLHSPPPHVSGTCTRCRGF